MRNIFMLIKSRLLFISSKLENSYLALSSCNAGLYKHLQFEVVRIGTLECDGELVEN